MEVLEKDVGDVAPGSVLVMKMGKRENGKMYSYQPPPRGRPALSYDD